MFLCIIHGYSYQCTALKAAIPLLTVLRVCVAVHPLGHKIIPLVTTAVSVCVRGPLRTSVKGHL